MIEVNKVTKKFGDFTAIRELSLKVGKASIYGLVGYNGAGKTTLLKTVAGVYKATNGEVLIGGENVYNNAIVKQRIFYVPDDLFFEPYSTLKSMSKFYKGYYPNFSDKTFGKLIEVFGLDSNKRINSFSKGMQRQGGMILGMSTRPSILLLDESFDGLDPAKRALMNNMLKEYTAETQCSVIVSSHNLHELADLCDHIGLINGQKIVMDCSVEEISGSRSKFRLLFEKELTKDDFSGIFINKFNKDGKLITITVSGDVDEAEKKLREMKPLSLEKFPLSLEEIFLEEMEGTEYDFSEIFS